MWDRITEWLGLKKHSPYVSKYLERANFETSIYMSLVVMALEIWMLIRTFVLYVVKGDKTYGLDWIMPHVYAYCILLASASALFIFSIRYVRNKTDNGKLGLVILVIFSIIALVFGMYISSVSYAEGRQILTFLTMDLFVCTLIVWRPYISFLVISSTFLIFYEICLRVKGVFVVGDQINYFCYYVFAVMISISIYFQRMEEATKAERLESANHHLEKLAIEDDITGIKNINYFVNHATVLMHQNKDRLNEMIFLYLDIENFKNYNDQYGFERGCDFLIKVAKRLDELFSDSLVTRQSDDHFLILTDREGARERVAEIRSFIKNYQDEVNLGLKIGGYIPVSDEVDPHLAADKARYACGLIKKMFDKDYKEYDESVDKMFRKRQYIVNNIDKAIENGYIKVFYQPVVWAKDSNLCGYEALARWIDPKYGMLSPGDFIPILEEYRQIHKLDTCIFETVCRDIRQNLDEGRQILPVSINFSRLDFELMDAVEILEGFVKQYGIDKEYLHVEVTESAMLDDLGVLNRASDKLREFGYAIWLDDFGSGYSSLNFLKDYAFDVMKIDMRFLENFSHNDRAGVIIESIIELAGRIGMRTLAEGVETKEQADFLLKIGCERLQGYLFGKPMMMEEIKGKIESGEYQISDEVA